MFSADFIFRQQENLVDSQKCQAGFRPLYNKILFLLNLSMLKTSTLRMIIISYAGLSERRLIKFAEYKNFCLTRSPAYWRTKVCLCTKKKLST